MKSELSFILLAVVFCISTHSSGFAQAVAVNEGWTRIASDNGEISVEMPNGFSYFYDEAGFVLNGLSEYRYRNVQIINASDKKTYMCVEIYMVSDPKDYMEDLIVSSGMSSEKIETGLKDIVGRRVFYGKRNIEKLKGKPVFFEARYLASKTHLYIATVWKKGDADLAAKSFLSSIQLGPEPTVAGSQQKVSVPRITLNLIKPLEMKDIAGKAPEGLAKKIPKNEKLDERESQIVLYRPWAGNSRPVNNMVKKGEVKLLVTYGSNARISKVTHLEGLSGNSARNAFFSILRSKFLPMEVAGEPMSQDLTLIFTF